MKIYSSLEYVQNLVKNTKPSMAYSPDENFSDWQKKAKAKLEELLGLPLADCEDLFKINEENNFDGYKRIDFEFQSEEGYFINAHFLVPDGAKGKLPLAICLQGHSTGKHISLGVAKYPGDEESIAGGRDFAVRAVKEGVCALALELRYMGETGQDANGDPSCIRSNTSTAALLMGRTAIGERVWDVKRAIDVATKYFSDYIDAERIICMGNSGGGTATFYASCYDERIYLSMPSCAVCTYDASIIAMSHCACNFIPNIRRYFNMGDLACLIAPRRFVLVCGIEDSIFPLKGVEESYDVVKQAYKALGKEDLCHIVKGNGGHRFYPDEAWPIVHTLL